MKKIIWILFLQFNLFNMALGQHDYVKTGTLPDYSKSKAYSYIAYLDRLLKPNGDIEKWIASGNIDKAKRTLGNLDLNLNNVKEADAAYPLDGFMAKRTLLNQQLNGGATTTVSVEPQTTPKQSQGTTVNKSKGDFDLPDYSKSRAYNSIDYLKRMLKPNGTIEKLLAEGKNGRALEVAEGIQDHMNTVKKEDPNFPVHIFENRRKTLVGQADQSYASEKEDRHAKEDWTRRLSEQSDWLNQILLNDDYDDYFTTNDYHHANFIKALEGLDWKKTKTNLADYHQKYPEEVAAFSRLKNFEKSFQAQQDKWIVGAIFKTIDAVYERGEHSKVEARTYARRALALTEACLAILPNHSQTIALKKEAEKAVSNYLPNYPSTLHQENAGKLLFANQLLIPNQETGIKTSFTAGEHIYAMAYLDGAISDFTYASKNLVLTVYVDGAYNSEYRFSSAKLADNQMFIEIELLPNPDKIRHQGPETYAKGLKSISPRKHQVEVRVSAGLSGEIARGKFELNTSNGVDKIKTLYQKYQAFNAANVFLQASNRNDPQLEKNMVAAFKATGWEQIPVKATIFDADWRTVTHTVTGKILYRAIRGEITAQSPKGHCMLYFMDYWQDYQGNGRYSSMVKVRQSLGMKYMDCKNLTKVK